MNGLKISVVAGCILLGIFVVKLVAPGGGMGALRLEAAGQEGQEATTTKQREKSESIPQQQVNLQPEKEQPMEQASLEFGNFSVSLTVKDLTASKAFYEKLDFQQVGGGLEQNFVIMQNGTTTIGLFHGMFEKNILTFNPGWNHKSETLKEFQDVRELQAAIKARGITPVAEADPETTDAASFVIVDPDGNAILIDQHVPKSE